MLLNIVKFRYFDTPVFLDISSMIASYQIEAEATVGSSLLPHSTGTSTSKVGSSSAVTGNYLTLGAMGSYIERPTITYSPLTGAKFVDALLKPIPPQTIIAMIEAGHPADFILDVSVDAINGPHNRSAAPERGQVAGPTFDRVARALRHIQQAGALGTRVETVSGQKKTLISFRRDARADVRGDIDFVESTLGLRSANDEYTLTFGSQQHRPNEMALLTRSMQEILVELGGGVEVPPQDLADGRATPPPAPRQQSGDGPDYPLIHIHADGKKPPEPYAAAFYRNHWFWIDDRDLRSKRIFMFLMIFSSLSESGIVPQVPILTIPAQ
jgi:hypothetical protein